MIGRILRSSFLPGHRVSAVKKALRRPPFPKNEDGSVNVHLGCGKVDHPAFINIDVADYPHIHFIHTVERLPILPDRFADLVYASHCLEHLSYLETPTVLREWGRVLKPGGVLRLAVPDFDLMLQIYREQGAIEPILPALMGGQTSPYNFHKVAFTFQSLATLLEAAGFTRPRRWTPGSHALTTFEDWSSRPYTVNGTPYPISLNIEATKAE
jgi:predicted SAM-dependent methyltransferase